MRRFALGSVVMIPLTALGFLCAAAALAIQTINPRSDRWRWCGRVLSGLVFLLGLVMVAERLGGFELGVNTLLFANALSRYPYRPLGLMAGNSAVAFALLGGALSFPNARLSSRYVRNGLTLGAIILSAVALVGHAYGAHALYSFDQHAAMAVSTAACFVWIGVGLILSKPQLGLGALLITEDAGGIFTRRMLPITLVVPFLLGLAWVLGRRAELFGRETGVALVVVAIAGIYTAFLFHSARSVGTLDQERRYALATAETARMRAEDANRGKGEFLTMMSHELRTPLNAIRGYTQLLELGVRGPVTEEQRLDLARIRRNEEHLLGIIADILDFASVERGQYKYEIAPVALREVVQGASSAVQSMAASKGVRLVQLGWLAEDGSTQEQGEPPYVLADAQKLRQALINLLANAIKFGYPGSEVTIAVQPHHGEVQVTVADSGRGIPADRLPHIFDPFTQVDTALTRTNEGVGLGLAVSRQMIRGMGSDIRVESTLGVGSRFSILLRRATTGASSKPLTLREPPPQIAQTP
ncbi:MAG: HAMP domain-containing sensor histidine kinase [Gemmatimonadota bacterium]